jgi:hypothetical protein
MIYCHQFCDDVECQDVAAGIIASIVKCYLENRIKSKSETVEYFKLMEYKISTIYPTI